MSLSSRGSFIAVVAAAVTIPHVEKPTEQEMSAMSLSSIGSLIAVIAAAVAISPIEKNTEQKGSAMSLSSIGSFIAVAAAVAISQVETPLNKKVENTIEQQKRLPCH